MSRVVAPIRAALAAVLGTALLTSGSVLPAGAQELPPCDDTRRHDCQLPDWEAAGAPDLPSLFGDPQGLVWLEDEVGDVAPAGLDILGAGVARVTIDDPTTVRKSEGLLKRGKIKQAVPRGRHYLVRVELDRPLDAITDAHAGVHVATDINSSRGSNAPSGVGQPGNPFAGSQDVFSVTYATTTGKTRLLDSDLARKWYKGKDPFAAAWAAPNVLDVLVRVEDFGEDFRAVSFVSGPEGGFDSLSLGPAPIPVDGAVDLVPVCIEGSISAEPFTVRRLFDDGQRLNDVETPASWRGGVVLPVDADERAAMAALISSSDDDGDGTIALPAGFRMFEDGQVVRQRGDAYLRLADDGVALWTELGLTRRGYDLLRDISIDPTDDPDADAWLRRAQAAWRTHTPPFRSTRKGGLLVGEGLGACIEAFAEPPEPVAEPPDGSAGSSEATADATVGPADEEAAPSA